MSTTSKKSNKQQFAEGTNNKEGFTAEGRRPR